jgi:hypothetical protein
MHPEVKYKLLLIFVSEILIVLFIYLPNLSSRATEFSSRLICYLYNLLYTSLLILLYVVKFFTHLVLLSIIIFSDNLECLNKQQPTQWLRDFTQLDSPDDA